MALKVSTRGCIPSFMVMDVLKAANQKKLDGESVYHLEIGQPGTGAPSGVVEAVGEPLYTLVVPLLNCKEYGGVPR